MWQRVQTLYLAISTVLIALMFFSPKAVVYASDGTIAQEYTFCSNFAYLVLLIIIAALNVLALTCYKFRVFQFRTTILTAIMTIALQVWLFVDFAFTHGDMVFKVYAIFPIVAVILDVLAARGILADQLLVESAYHLRKSRRDRRGRKK